MADIQLYQQSQVPRAVRQAAPSFAMADRSAQIGAGETLSQVGGDLFNKYLNIRFANEKSSFDGQVKALQDSWEAYLTSNPNATIEQMEKEKQRIVKEIDKAGSKLSMPASQQYAKNWMLSNRESLETTMNADRDAIGIQQQTEVYNAQLQTARKENDKEKVFTLLDLIPIFVTSLKYSRI